MTNGSLCDDWELASHNGELVHAVEAELLDRSGVTTLGEVLAGAAAGRTDDAEITAFDSTGLAIQDLAVALGRVRRLSRVAKLERLRRRHSDRGRLTVERPEED